MVKRIESEYQHGGAVYYFKTDDRMVKVLDENNNEIGTLKELAFDGKTINGGDFRDIKKTGLYKVKGLTGLPNNIPADKECMLAVQSIGSGLTLYRLIAPNGVIVENTVSSGSQSGWGTGGIGLRNTIADINNSLGEVRNLQTQSKNLTAALNEVLSKINAMQKGNNSRLQDLEGKNYDDRYLLKTGGKLIGNLQMQNGNAIQLSDKKDMPVDFGYMNSNDELIIGDKRYSTKIVGKDLTLNGAKVLTSGNFEGMGLSAGKLGGLTVDDFIQVNKDDTKNGTLSFSRNNHLDFDIGGDDNRIINLRSGKTQTGSIHANSQGALEYLSGGFQVIADGKDHVLKLQHSGGIELNDHINDNYEPRITWRRLDDKGAPMDAGIWLCQPAKWGGWTDDEKNHTVVWWNGRTNQQIAQYGYGSNGEALRIFHSPYIGEHNSRLFIQNEQPSGDIPYGSVWIGL